MSTAGGRSGLVLPPPEPEAPAWQLMDVAEVGHRVLAAAGRVRGRPVVIAVDGRSGSGKSTLARRLAALSPGSALVHTDDVSWYESFFGWDQLLIDGVLRPAHAGQLVSFRPPAWDDRDRPGAIEVPAGATVLLVEGVGASRTSLGPWLDAAVWVQSDHVAARLRGLARDVAARDGAPMSDGSDAAQFWDEWEAQEAPFMAADRPWERAALIACGTPDVLGITHDPEREVVASLTGQLDRNWVAHSSA